MPQQTITPTELLQGNAWTPGNIPAYVNPAGTQPVLVDSGVPVGAIPPVSTVPPTPSISNALDYIRINAAGSAYEVRTPAQALGDIGISSAMQPVVQAATLAAGELALFPNAVALLCFGGVMGGTSTALTLTTSPAPAAYAAGQIYTGIASVANGLNPTLVPNGLAAKPIYRDGANGPVALLGGEMAVGGFYGFEYDPALNSGSGGLHLIGMIAKSAGPLNVLDFGAKGDGVTDDTAAIQAAINAAQASATRTLLLPGSTYKITSTLNITAQIKIVGDDRQTSVLAPNAFFNAIAINTTASAVLQDFGISYAASATSGAVGISVTAGASAENVGSQFRNLAIAGAYNGIVFTKASLFVVDGCFIVNMTNVGIQVQNTNNVDSGDSTIVNTTIGNVGIAGTTYGVQYLSSGGLRIENSKINGPTYGVQLAYNGTTLASDLFVVGCSIEGGSMLSAVAITRSTTTGTWSNVIIADNEFEAQGSSGVAVSVPTDANGLWLTALSVTGNIIFLGTAGSPVGISVDSTGGFTLSNNTMISNVSTTKKILTGAGANFGVVGPNIGFGSGFAASSISSTNTTQIAPT